MKVLNTFYGTQPYNFEAEPYHKHAKYMVDAETIQSVVNQCKTDLKKGVCFWYVTVISDINPFAKQVTFETFFDGVDQLTKIILNKSAKPSLENLNKQKKQAIKLDLIYNQLYAMPVEANNGQIQLGNAIDIFGLPVLAINPNNDAQEVL